MGKFLIKKGERVVFIGDSITDCGRRKEFIPFGDGYVRMVIDLITAKYPERKLEFHNMGISGNTVEDLQGRWQDDAILLKPDWLTIKIGINDLHLFLKNQDRAVAPERFREVYREILQRTKEKTKAKIVLIDPFYISLESSDFLRGKVLKLLPEYLSVVSDMAKEFKTLHVKTHEAFLKQLKYKTSEYFCPEPVHPNHRGHTVIAYELLKKLNW